MQIFSRRELTKALKDVENDRLPEAAEGGRRQMLQRLGLMAASGALAYSCGKDSSSNAAAVTCAANTTTDISNMNAALGLEQEAVAVYTAAAGLPIWTQAASGTANAPTYLDVAVSFRDHHAKHAADLSAVITGMGGTPVTAKTAVEYFIANGIPESAIGGLTLAQVLPFAMKKELFAAQAYAALASALTVGANAGLFARLAGDESAHYAIFRAAFTFLDPTVATGAEFKAASAATLIPGAYPGDWPKPA